jgi:hypothetical protein
MDFFDQRFQKEPSIVSQEIAGEVILVPVRQSVGELDSIFTLNETAAYAWSLIDGQRTLDEIHQQILAEYDVDEDVNRRDLRELVGMLKSIGAIISV